MDDTKRRRNMIIIAAILIAGITMGEMSQTYEKRKLEKNRQELVERINRK